MRKLMFCVVLLTMLLVAAVSVSAQGGPAFVRFAHLSPSDFSTVDVYVDGVSRGSLKGLEYGEVSSWIQLSPGDHEIAVRVPGRSRALLGGPMTLTLEEGNRKTIVVKGAAPLQAQIVDEDYSELGEEEARVTIIHGIQGGPDVNVVANGNTVSPLVFRLGYENPDEGKDGIVTLDVPAGTYDLQVIATEGGAVILDLPGTVIEAGKNYFVAAAGTAAEPRLVLAATDNN